MSVPDPAGGTTPSDAGPGEFVTESFAYDGGRRVTVYVPPERPEAIVYAGDGQLIAPWAARVPSHDLVPTMVVGVHRTDDPDEMARLAEYSPAIDEPRFVAHERFLVGEVREWVRSRFGVGLPPGRTAAYGVSAGGELALALGMRHPQIYGIVLAASPGEGYRPPATFTPPLPRVYLVAGTQEPFFLANANRWAEALRPAGADVRMQERAGDHGDPFWAEEFPLMLGWAFGGGTR